jgi:hypothetical protein
MATKRKLTAQEIEVLASREGARRIAVENFLMTVHVNPDARAASFNAIADGRVYGWNAATMKSIQAGIRLAFGTW